MAHWGLLCQKKERKKERKKKKKKKEEIFLCYRKFTFKCAQCVIGMDGLDFRYGEGQLADFTVKSQYKAASLLDCSCFIPLKRPLMSWQKAMGRSTLKNIFRTLFHIRQRQILTSLPKRFLSFNLEARSLSLSFDRERSRMRTFNSC
jgi:hypothetical protein